MPPNMGKKTAKNLNLWKLFWGKRDSLCVMVHIRHHVKVATGDRYLTPAWTVLCFETLLSMDKNMTNILIQTRKGINKQLPESKFTAALHTRLVTSYPAITRISCNTILNNNE